MNDLEQVEPVSDDELNQHCCLESVDRVSDDPETTAFKRRARLHQALWRERKSLPVGVNPRCPTEKLGSCMDIEFARKSGNNFLNDAVKNAVHHRIEHREDAQMIDENRLYGNLLSSMPMCFNLFGSLHDNPALNEQAIHRWWPDVVGEVSPPRFEWSPGRKDPEYLDNRSAFDVAFEIQMENGQQGIIGIETKYHEHCKREKLPNENRRKRYEEVTKKSNIFKPDAVKQILGNDLQQIWLDHLLALSMLQHSPQQWHWVKFVLVHPARNPSYAKAAERYSKLLSNTATFEVRTIESLLDAQALPLTTVAAFRERYFL